ncbi:hypothetical protein [Flammeovirga agarivorans]|uniref:Uncharacterized protein n=1 Tax=Flammeovirga agarivorans TaxID=2726742 RepID=A0A7X8SRE0_9BACT|nr:hypothetical protein [Flammeovirga agarivorans]NLR94883.1 hypothetical protein [Flammeovirga agarivorans]
MELFGKEPNKSKKEETLLKEIAEKESEILAQEAVSMDTVPVVPESNEAKPIASPVSAVVQPKVKRETEVLVRKPLKATVGKTTYNITASQVGKAVILPSNVASVFAYSGHVQIISR